MEWVSWLVFFLGMGMGGLSLYERKQLRNQKERFGKMLAVHQEQQQLLGGLASKFKAAIEQLPDEARMAIRLMPKLRAGLTEVAVCPMCGAVVPMPGGVRKEN